ncbi:Ankyrin repeat domain-containing protein SOWAHB [Bagarius yarrelli]|uniref:Ankyrin repeat domain-containing protein SOWAHB n=1 Tax=Bagarius yarrelli TaxID=175774 RepID=A0A556TU48_BAGYA|nr:Ankyrin repeat domain-containing protein SOWAHB [Bagarius yarrelli]
MATDLSQDSVLRFLLRNGGHVRNGDLLTHFKEFLREHEDRLQNRELFKRYVNAVATVKQEDGVSYVVLRKKYRPHLGDVPTSADTPGSRTDKKQEVAGRKPKQGENSSLQSQLLPVAGIRNNSRDQIKSVHLDKTFQTSSHQPWEQKVSSVPSRDKNINTCILGMSSCPTDSRRSSGSGQSFGQPSEVKGISERANPKHSGAKPEQLREADGCSQKSFCPPPAYLRSQVIVTAPSADREHKHTLPASFQTFDRNPSCAWPFSIPFRQSPISASSPCLVETPGEAIFFNAQRQAGLSQSNENLLRPDCYGQAKDIYIYEPQDYAATAAAAAAAPVSPTLQRHSIPLETPHPQVAYGHLEPKYLQRLSSSQTSLNRPASSINSGWPQALPQDNWSSDDALNYHSDVLKHVAEQSQFGNHHSHEVKLLSQLHHPERQFTPWHNSTGHLLDKEPQGLLPSSAPDESTRNGPVARRLSHHMRSRMCRSLGADLDKAFREDGDKARLKRLHRITSFLNVSSSQTHSPLESVSPASSVRSLGHESSSYGHRNVHVPMEPQEHEWFVKAATGNWTDVYSLFREDPNLLAKRDFVSGYTVLHWIAKHGDHRVLNTLWYGVQKLGMTLDIDVRSTCGYTPLHLAAIHGHKNLLRLLVHKFKANVALRDNNGKRPWQYLGKINDRDLFELLGAPQAVILASAGVQWSSDRPPVVPVNRSAATVKRHSSIAALFKHKNQLRVPTNAESL